MKNDPHDIDIVNEVLAERNRQRDLAGIEELDQRNTRNDWVGYIAAYSGRAADKVSRNQMEGQDFRANMVKVAALALAAIDACDKGYC